MPSAAQTKPVAAPACPMDEPPAPTSIAIPVSAATPPAPQPTHPHRRPRRKPEDGDSEVPDVGASCDTATPKAPAIANRVSADPMPSASTLWTVRVLSPAAFAKCSCDQDFASRRVRTIAESIFICASMSLFQAWRLCLNQLGSRSPSCNDPAVSAQVRPLKHMPQRVSSFPAPGADAGSCRTGSSHSAHASRVAGFRTGGGARIAPSTSG